jgi:alpha-N-arabinofuranosidase
LYSSAVIDKKKGELIIKLVNSSSSVQLIELNLEGIKPANKNALIRILSANDLYSYNKLSELDKLAPVEKTIEVRSNKIKEQLSPYSFSVIKVAYSRK